MITRPETPDDFPRIYRLVKTAFEGEPHAEGDEQDFVERLRDSDDYIAALSLVTEICGRMVGHLMMIRLGPKAGPSGSASGVLLLAAVSVELEWRNRGIGSRLIEEALRRARSLGHGAVLVVGDPVFYQRFGFRSSIEFGISNANGIEDQYVQALELTPGFLRGSGRSVSLPA